MFAKPFCKISDSNCFYLGIQNCTKTHSIDATTFNMISEMFFATYYFFQVDSA